MPSPTSPIAPDAKHSDGGSDDHAVQPESASSPAALATAATGASPVVVKTEPNGAGEESEASDMEASRTGAARGTRTSSRYTNWATRAQQIKIEEAEALAQAEAEETKRFAARMQKEANRSARAQTVATANTNTMAGVHRNHRDLMLAPGAMEMLNMLAGRVSKKCGVTMSHSIKFNGEASSPAHYGSRIAYVENTPSLQTRSFSPRSRATLTLRSFCRYVMQDDALFPTATVRETVMFAAFLRPGPFAACEFAKKRELVDMLLKALGLWGCRDTLIGNPPMITGVSGGEKRRVSIACELVTIPEILFLDEPTSGLDSFAAYQVVTALQSLAAAGCTVLCTIHQPSSEVFRLFDNTVLLVNGATVYHGRVDGMTDYFSSDAGGNIACPPGFNPADHFMFHVQKEPKAALQLMEDR